VPVFYGVTSHGLDALPVVVRRVAPSRRPFRTTRRMRPGG
jgi:hypothetical protein